MYTLFAQNISHFTFTLKAVHSSVNILINISYTLFNSSKKMKKLLLLIVLSLPLFCFVQTDTTSTPKEQYCMILATGKMFSSKVSIEVDFGQPTKFFSSNTLKDESGKIMSFNSVIDALNYMASKGWLFVNAYVITTSSQNVLHYVMRKPIAASAK
jgi:hypothetical protein